MRVFGPERLQKLRTELELMNYRLCVALALTSLFTPASALRVCAAKESKTALPDKPALPVIRSLKLEPASLNLEDGRDERRVLVWGEAAGGQRFDLTGEATLKCDSSAIEIDKTGYIVPRDKGKAEVTVTFGNLK